MITNNIRTNTIFNGITVAQNTTTAGAPGKALNLDELKIGGNFAAEVTITGAGTITLGYLTSTDGITFIKPSTSSALTTALTIATGLTATGGVASNGKYYIPLTNIPVTPYLQIYATEQNVGSAVVTLTLVMQ